MYARFTTQAFSLPIIPKKGANPLDWFYEELQTLLEIPHSVLQQGR